MKKSLYRGSQPVHNTNSLSILVFHMTKLHTVSSTFDKETHLLQFLRAAFDGEQRLQMEDYIAPEASFCGPVTGGVTVPMQEWAEFSSVVKGLVGPSTFEVTHKVEQGDWLTLRLHIRSECLITGKAIEGFDCLLVRFQGDRIAEYIGHMDYLSFFQELDLVPPGALHACLSGQRLTWE
uniref:ester cyclase n=2 Tax=Phaeobacter TaxID=302485 RepID=UPI0023804908|nr:ester cyclase [Phaeobacter sp. PT47_59]